MITVENVDVYGWEAAIRGMRSPMNSWHISDTDFTVSTPVIGENDMKLMKALIKGGTEHRKFLRMVTVTMDITAPLYWWKEFDTYKVGTVANSCSTMHKIHSKEFKLDDFSHEHLDMIGEATMMRTINNLNIYRNLYNETKDKHYWWNMIQLLPSSYNQRRTVQMNYEVVLNIVRQRENHKLDEWIIFTDRLKNLPYVREMTIL